MCTSAVHWQIVVKNPTIRPPKMKYDMIMLCGGASDYNLDAVGISVLGICFGMCPCVGTPAVLELYYSRRWRSLRILVKVQPILVARRRVAASV